MAERFRTRELKGGCPDDVELLRQDLEGNARRAAVAVSFAACLPDSKHGRKARALATELHGKAVSLVTDLAGFELASASLSTSLPLRGQFCVYRRSHA
ncbi:hypothetical protein [Deinococcus hopiensis]|uniref:Uncharacterized protein n=1 Tax=Deinococcus hopiensis KR-140 TaxID=695939 RepID=A0A1W1UZB6_9DEIO|nr:hypothetical protein [Deinococcus hopiensis]SMB86350.1 hypothetical protein SAMN00790413_03781 [Deinococcus hopiensis KR-140]